MVARGLKRLDEFAIVPDHNRKGYHGKGCPGKVQILTKKKKTVWGQRHQKDF